MINDGAMNIPAITFIMAAMGTFDEYVNTKEAIANPIRQTHNIHSGFTFFSINPYGICVPEYAIHSTDDTKPTPVEVVSSSLFKTSVKGANEARYT